MKTLQTSLPVRNGLTLSDDGQFIAAAEGSYRDGEGHRTIVEIWNATDEHPIQVLDTGEILGVWNLLFSPDATMLAVDTQKHAQSGIRVWELEPADNASRSPDLKRIGPEHSLFRLLQIILLPVMKAAICGYGTSPKAIQSSGKPIRPVFKR